MNTSSLRSSLIASIVYHLDNFGRSSKDQTDFYHWTGSRYNACRRFLAFEVFGQELISRKDKEGFYPKDLDLINKLNDEQLVRYHVLVVSRAYAQL